jgi:probable F420-dependent oxidoreductase
MDFGVCLPNFGRYASPEAVAEVARAAEEEGYTALWATDHILVPSRYRNPYGHLLEALTTLGYVAALTEKVRLGTSILVLPMRDPFLVAKQVAALDRLSRGRVVLGVGVGWLEEEFRYLGYTFTDRGKRCDEAIGLLRALWRGEPEFQGHYYRYQDGVSEPRPYQAEGPEIWVGGDSRPALRRVARLGDAWHPVGLKPEELQQGLETLQAMTSRKVRLTLRLTVNIGGRSGTYRTASGATRVMLGGPPSRVIKGLERYLAVGVEHLACSFGDRPLEEQLRRLRLFAQEVMPSFT